MADREDLKQMALLEVYNRIKKQDLDPAIDYGSCLINWIKTPFHSEWVRRNANKRRGTVISIHADDDNAGIDPAIDDDPSIPLERKETSQQVSDAIRGAISRTKLSESERDSFDLVAMQGLSYEEAAKLLGITIKVVDNAVTRAKRKLKTSLARIEEVKNHPAFLQQQMKTKQRYIKYRRDIGQWVIRKSVNGVTRSRRFQTEEEARRQLAEWEK
jgi:RNA polymerase sigma factor (sigma-70 family)